MASVLEERAAPIDTATDLVPIAPSPAAAPLSDGATSPAETPSTTPTPDAPASASTEPAAAAPDANAATPVADTAPPAADAGLPAAVAGLPAAVAVPPVVVAAPPADVVAAPAVAAAHSGEIVLLTKTLEEQRGIFAACASQLDELPPVSRLLVEGWLTEVRLQLARADRQILQLTDASTPPPAGFDAAWNTLSDIMAALSSVANESSRTGGASSGPIGLLSVARRLQVVTAFLGLQALAAVALLAWSIHVVGVLTTATGAAGKGPIDVKVVVLGSLLGMIAITMHLNWKFRQRWDSPGFLAWYVTKLIGAPIISVAVIGLLSQTSLAAGDIKLSPATPLLVFSVAVVTGLFSNSMFNWLGEKAGVATSTRSSAAPGAPVQNGAQPQQPAHT